MPISEVERDITAPAVANRQSTGMYKDYRNTDPQVFVMEAYGGVGGFSGKTKQGKHRPYSYIIPNASENFYQTRVQMSTYLNYFKKYINAKYKPIFKTVAKTYVETPTGNSFEEHLFLDFCDNITGSGMTVNDFMKSALKSAIISDVSFIVMDKRAEDVLPFLYLVTADKVCDYTTDTTGALVSIMFDDRYDGKFYYRRYIGIDGWQILRSEDGSKWVVESSGENTIGMLPVYAFFVNRPDDPADYRPFPSNYDIAAFCAWLYDKGSKLDYVIDKQAHSILALQGDINAVPNGVDNALVIGTSDRTVFPPQYLSPDSAMPGVHAERIEQVTKAMFDIMSDSGVAVSEIQAPESGYAKSYTFAAQNDELKYNRTLLTNAMKWVVGMFKVFTGDTGDWIAYTEYPTDFNPTASLTVEQATELIEFYGIEGLRESQIDMHRKLRQIVDPMSSKEDEQSLVDEIEMRYRRVD